MDSPLPFEDQAAYTARRIADRLTPEMLDAYCRALGIRRNDPEFYLSDALLIEQDRSGWGPVRTLTADEWARVHR
ncbi:hypothetical protein [Microbacterium sp. HJ5]